MFKIQFGNSDSAFAMHIKDYLFMNFRRDEMRIYYNVLTGSLRILSPNGRFEYRIACRTLRHKAPPEDRIRDLIVLLKVVRKLRSRQTSLASVRKKIIEAQLFRRQQ